MELEMLLLDTQILVYSALAAAVIIHDKYSQQTVVNRDKVRRRARRRFWVKPWLLRRPQYGHYETLLAELLVEDHPGFQNHQRVSPELFQELLNRVGPRIERQTTFWRKPLEPGLRLAITLRYLATGNTCSYNFAYNVIVN
jgi:hypothetical protein